MFDLRRKRGMYLYVVYHSKSSMLLEKIFTFIKIILASTSPSSCVPCNCFGNSHTLVCDSTMENENNS
jgi:hypothetical protein